MPTALEDTSCSELRPNKLGAGVRLTFFSLLAAAFGVGIGFGAGAACLGRTASQLVVIILVAVVSSSVINIVFSQLAAQTLLSARLSKGILITSTLFTTRQAPADTINAIYVAPNFRYNNLIVDTKSGPQLLSNAIWSPSSFALIENRLRNWAATQKFPVLDVDTVWVRTEADRRARSLLLQCFRQPYFATLGFILGIAAVSFSTTALSRS